MDTYSPFGLRPAYHPSGTIRPVAGAIASTYGTNIFQFAPIAADPTSGLIVAAAAAGRALGSFSGVEYTGAQQRRFYSNYWPTGTVATEIVCYYTEDPLIVYNIQANATVAVGAVGSQLNWTSNGSSDGSLTTGLSTVGADVAGLTNSGNAGLRILALAPYLNNAWGDAFPILEVQISQHQYVADRVAF